MTNVTYSPSHRQTGAPMINIQSTLPTAPDLCKIVSVGVSYYLVTTVTYIQSVRSHICVYIHTYSSQYKEGSGAKEIKKNWDSSECRVPWKTFHVTFWARVSPVLQHFFVYFSHLPIPHLSPTLSTSIWSPVIIFCEQLQTVKHLVSGFVSAPSVFHLWHSET